MPVICLTPPHNEDWQEIDRVDRNDVTSIAVSKSGQRGLCRLTASIDGREFYCRYIGTETWTTDAYLRARLLDEAHEQAMRRKLFDSIDGDSYDGVHDASECYLVAIENKRRRGDRQWGSSQD